MDNTMSPLEKIFSKRGYKFLLFLVSYILAAEVTTVFIVITLRGGFNDSEDFLILILTLIGFPLGFGFPIFSHQLLAPGTGFFIGWLSYLGITVYSVVIKNNHVAIVLYLIFVFLLILNVVGLVIFLGLESGRV